jgi:5S rRNA maturation endonuclease (ribonuclease M5)
MNALDCQTIAHTVLGPPVNSRGDELFYRCTRPERHRNGDSHPSLKINARKNVFACFPCGESGTPWQLAAFLAGYSPDNKAAVKTWLRARGLIHGTERQNVGGSEDCIVGTYDFVDEAGGLLFQEVRFEPKNFKMRRPGDKGGWIWNLANTRRVLYRLPEVLNADTVLVCEGPKDCDAAAAIGFVATTNPNGAQSQWLPEYSVFLRGKNITVIADADAPGRKHAASVATHLRGQTAALRVVEMPNAKDLSEWIEAGGCREQLLSLIGNAPEWQPHSTTRPTAAACWVGESMREFLADESEDVEALYEPLFYRETITQIFSPRGLGKRMFALFHAVAMAQKNIRVLYIDRDNPRRVIRERLRSMGADVKLPNLKILSREHCPSLTKPDQWQSFPYDQYDAVILDSLDSMAEGVGEQDSAKPSRALAPILDIAHRDNGPAVLLLGNCVKTGAHSRGSGVIEDRADIVCEVRDATDFHPTGSRPWIAELPAQGASDWVARSSRRKLRESFRLALVYTKFRLGEEPAPTIWEMNTSSEPWQLRDITDEVDREGAVANEARKNELQDARRNAVDALQMEIMRRVTTGEDQLLKTEAEIFLTTRRFKRTVAREAICSPVFQIEKAVGQGHPKTIRLAVQVSSRGGNNCRVEAAKTQAICVPDFRQPHEQSAAETDAEEHQYSWASQEGSVSAGAVTCPAADTCEPGALAEMEEGEI